MTRNPPRLPLPFPPQRNLRRPLLPGMIAPCSGLKIKANCRARYSSSSRSSRTSFEISASQRNAYSTIRQWRIIGNSFSSPPCITPRHPWHTPTRNFPGPGDAEGVIQKAQLLSPAPPGPFNLTRTGASGSDSAVLLQPNTPVPTTRQEPRPTHRARCRRLAC